MENNQTLALFHAMEEGDIEEVKNLGEYTISEKVIETIISHVGNSVKGIQHILRIKSKNTYDGIKITIELVVYYGIPIDEIMKELAEKVQVEIEKLTALNIIELSVITKGIFMI